MTTQHFQSLPRMFVITGLETKRRPMGVNKSNVPIEKQRAEKLGLLPAVPHSHRHHSSKLSSSPSARRVSKARMTRNNNYSNTYNRSEKGRRPPIKFTLGRPAPALIHKFTPRPLILVEKMKARQILLESSPPISSEPCVAPELLNRSITAMNTPLSAHVAPAAQGMLTYSNLSSNSYSYSSVSFRTSSRNGVIFNSGLGMMPRSVRPLSVATLGDSSSSTDTFVAESPCCIKQASKVPVLVIDATSVRMNAESDPEKKRSTDTGVSVPIDSAAGDFMLRTCQSTDTFEPIMTSTPFISGQANTNVVPSPTATVYPTHPSEQTPGRSDSFEIVSPTSRAVYPFNASKGAYIVKLPRPASAISLSNEARFACMSSTAMPSSVLTHPRAPMTLVNVPGPKPPIDCKRLPHRVASPSPTLVLDGVFALPSSSPPRRQTLKRFPRPRPRKLSSWRPPPPPPPPTPSDTFARAPHVNALAIVPRSLPLHSPSPTSSRGHPDPESPRSKLARVLTAHVRQQMSTPMSMPMTRVHPQGIEKRCVPPLVKGVQASNDPKTQREIEGLRARRVVGVQARRGDGNGTVERMSLASIGMVAKLRARWEKGEGSYGASL